MFDLKNKIFTTPPYKNDNVILSISEESQKFNHPTLTLPVQGGKRGFTLAEVLITLVIIGVIAAITVPTLITKYQKEQTITKLKKMYSTLSQTTQRAIADNGPIETWELGAQQQADSTKAFFNKYMAPYLSLVGPATTQEEGGWNNKYTLLDNSATSNANYTVRTYFNDGSSMTFRILYNNATSKIVAFNVDINGDKKPNKMGKDIFQYFYNLISGKFVPAGASYSREEILETNCSKQGSGAYCSALIMKDGWRIADDYPW